MQIPTTVKLEEILRNKMQNLATIRKRSIHSLMVEAIETFIDREEKRESWRQEGIRAYEHYEMTGLHLTHDEVLEWMDRVIAGEDVELPGCHI